MSAVLKDNIIKRISSQVVPLQENPWSGWAKGTTVTRQFNEHDPQGKDCSAQSQISYEVIDKDKNIHRIQTIGRHSKRQEFMIADEKGLEKPKRAFNGIDAALRIDNVLVMSKLRRISVTTTDYERVTTNQYNQWSLLEHPNILIRRVSELETWAIVSLNITKSIGRFPVSCIELESKKKIASSEYIVTTQFLNSRIPGHLVEETTIHYKVDEKNGQTFHKLLNHQVTIAFSLNKQKQA